MDQLTRRLGGSIKFNCELWVKAKSAVDTYTDNCCLFAQQLEATIQLWKRMPIDAVLHQMKELLTKVDNFLEHGRLIMLRQANPSGSWAFLSWSPEYQKWMDHVDEMCQHLEMLKSSVVLPSLTNHKEQRGSERESLEEEEKTIDSAIAFIELAKKEYLSPGSTRGARDSLQHELEALQTTAKVSEDAIVLNVVCVL
jgi:hypothetical protein